LTYAVFAENGTVDAGLPCMVDQLLDEEVRTLLAFGGDDGRERVEPLPGLARVGIVRRPLLPGRPELFRHCRHGRLRRSVLIRPKSRTAPAPQ
jgi:hypothetical protein